MERCVTQRHGLGFSGRYRNELIARSLPHSPQQIGHRLSAKPCKQGNRQKEPRGLHPSPPDQRRNDGPHEKQKRRSSLQMHSVFSHCIACCGPLTISAANLSWRAWLAWVKFPCRCCRSNDGLQPECAGCVAAEAVVRRVRVAAQVASQRGDLASLAGAAGRCSNRSSAARSPASAARSIHCLPFSTSSGTSLFIIARPTAYCALAFPCVAA